MCGMRRDFIFEAADESRAKRDKKNMYLKLFQVRSRIQTFIYQVIIKNLLSNQNIKTL